MFTAEGSIDTQTTRGKIPAEVGHRAKEYGVPVIALAGTIGKDAHIVHEHGIDAYFSTVPAPCTREHAMEHAAEQIELCAENIMRAILVSMQIGDELRSRRSSSIA